jgi:putative transcriptional regulator
MRTTIAESIVNTVTDLNDSGLIDEITMKNIHSLCLPEVKEYSPEKIVSIRKQLKFGEVEISVYCIS